VTRALRGPIDDTKSEGEAQARRDLLSHMNHELRTPLTTILGFAELLSTSDLDEQQREWNASVIRAARRLRTILDETLQQ
jgi:signal transduction histidine kinase